MRLTLPALPPALPPALLPALLLALLCPALGCSGDRVRTIAPPTPPTAAPAPDAPDAPAWTPPPPGHHAGYQPGPPLLRSPKERWFLMLDGPVVEPIQHRDGRFFALANGTVYAADTAGKLLWKINLSATDLRIGPSGLWVTVTDRLLLLAPADGTVLRTIDAPEIRGPAEEIGTGEEADPQVAWISRRADLHTPAGVVPIAQTPAGHLAADGGVVYATTLEGELLAVRGTEILWRTLLPGAPCGGPTLDGARAYVPIAAAGKERGGLVAYDRQTGAEAWRFRTGYQPGGPISAGESVWVADKDGAVYALKPETGAEVWRADGAGEYRTQPIWNDRSLYAGGGDGRLYRIDLDDGGTAWSTSLGAPVTGDPVMVEGLMVVGTAAGRLVGLAEDY